MKTLVLIESLTIQPSWMSFLQPFLSDVGLGHHFARKEVKIRSERAYQVHVQACFLDLTASYGTLLSIT